MKEAVLDKYTGKTEYVVDKTSNSYNVTQSKLSDKGIDCTNWFDEYRFNKRFIFTPNTPTNE